PPWPAWTCCRGRLGRCTSWRSTPCRDGGRWPRQPAWTWPRPCCASSPTSTNPGDRAMLPPSLVAQTACISEATARKPCSRHRFRDLAASGYVDFLLSAAAVAPLFEMAPVWPVGASILEAVRETRRVVATNTNLGILLLLVPLAAVPPGEELRGGLGR